MKRRVGDQVQRLISHSEESRFVGNLRDLSQEQIALLSILPEQFLFMQDGGHGQWLLLAKRTVQVRPGRSPPMEEDIVIACLPTTGELREWAVDIAKAVKPFLTE